MYAVSGEDKRPQRSATAAVTKATRTAGTESRDLPENINDWKVSDVEKWLKQNNLTCLLSKYDTVYHYVAVH